MNERRSVQRNFEKAIEPDICEKSTEMGGEPIGPAEGLGFRSFHFQFRISRPAISRRVM